MAWFLGQQVTGPVVEQIEYHTAEHPYCPDLSCPMCRINVGYHGQVTGALTSDEYHKGVTTSSFLNREVDDSLFELAMATLGAK